MARENVITARPDGCLHRPTRLYSHQGTVDWRLSCETQAFCLHLVGARPGDGSHSRLAEAQAAFLDGLNHAFGG